MSDIQIEIENVKNENDIDDDENKTVFDDDKPPHNGKKITRMEVSPNETYVITYSRWDDSIVGWNVVYEGQFKPEFSHKVESNEINQLCVSDDKKLAYTYIYIDKPRIYDMNIDNDQNIRLDVSLHNFDNHFNFNLKNEFVTLFRVEGYHIIQIYSTQTKNNEWKCKRMYKMPDTYKCIGILKYDKIYFHSNNSIYELNILTKKNIKIFDNEKIKYHEKKEFYDNEGIYFDNNNSNKFRNGFEISSNEKFIFLKFNRNVIIYSIELGISFDLNDFQLIDFMCFAGLMSYLLPINKEIQNFIEYCWKKCLDRLIMNVELPKEYQTGSFHISDKYAFVFLDGYVWKIKLEQEIDVSLKHSDDTIEDWNFISKINKKTYEMYECFHLINYMDTIHALFEEVISDNKEEEKLESTQNLIKWEIEAYSEEYGFDSRKYGIELQVFKKNKYGWDLICTTTAKTDEFRDIYLCGIKLFNNDAIILTTKGLFIYHFNENDNSITLNYHYYMNLDSGKEIDILRQHKEVFSKFTLPLPNFEDLPCSILVDNKEFFLKYGVELWSFAVRKYGKNNDERLLNDICNSAIKYDNKEILLKYIVELCSFVKEQRKNKDKGKNEDKEKNIRLKIVDICKNCIDYVNKEILLKCGVELLSLVIVEHELDLIDGIYKKCIAYFKEDPADNKILLSIIVSTMPLLNEYYPEYITRYSSETTMVIDSPFYSIERQNNNLHLCSFQPLQVVDLTRSILWTKYILLICELPYFVDSILVVIQGLIIFLLFPIYFTLFYILSKLHFINNICHDLFSLTYFYIIQKFSDHITIPTITFMNPYIKFVNYPEKYNWFLELIKPQPSPFVKVISADIYKTWNGEALINFKWNAYGKYYYRMIWIVFMALLGCFTTAATIPQQYIDDDIQNQLLIASIVLGFIHLSFEVRQMVYDFKIWIRDFWNLFDLIAFSFPIITSIYWLKTNNVNVPLLSFTCLFLDIKFLLFFRAFESFGVYFAIIISVGKQIISFLVVLLIIIISFAHAFYILLLPRNNFSFEERTINDDPNNPWNIVPSYNQVFENGTIGPNPFIIQPPNGNTNMFADFRTALFAMYNVLTGDSSALSNWTYTDNPSLAILVVLFSLLIVVYLMNLFIGLLNIAIDKDNNRVSYLLLKAEILAEIELFYLLPYQRRQLDWFPDVIYYYAHEDKTRKKINEMMGNNEWNTDGFPEMKQSLLKKLNIQYD